MGQPQPQQLLQPQPQQPPFSMATLEVEPPLSMAALEAAEPSEQKQMLGDKLFPRISKYQPQLGRKVTGMLLELDNSKLLMLLDSEQELKAMVDEAVRVLRASWVHDLI